MAATNNAGVVPVTESPLTWLVKSPNPVCGDVLVVQLPMIYGASSMVSIQVFYSTASDSAGVTWLNANQTAGGVNPMVFTYSPYINGRAIAPQQDTPANRITWGGCITTQNYLQPYMSANTTGVYQAFYGYYKTCFYNSVPAANYLMAAVVGDLQYQQIGETTGIIAEPSVLASAAAEFDNIQAIVDTTENFVQTPFIWGTYRLVVMPPSFPMGGASQPMLSYISQTTIVGDKS